MWTEQTVEDHDACDKKREKLEGRTGMPPTEKAPDRRPPEDV